MWKAAAKAPPSSTVDTKKSGERRRVQLPMMPLLLVEDDTLVARGLQMVLEEECETFIAASIREAKLLIPTRAWRGALVDVRLPDGDGTTLLALIRDHRPRIPIIVMTGAENAAHSHAAYSYGAQFVTKPMPLRWHVAFRGKMRGIDAPGALQRELERIGLSKSETDVFLRLGNGDTANEVATALGLSVYTVRTHCTNVHRDLGVSSLAEVLGIAAGWLSRRY